MAVKDGNRYAGLPQVRTPVLKSFEYYGGKARHLGFVLQHLAWPAEHFYDVFGGSGVVSLNVNYPARTYNDANEELVHFVRMVRDRSDELFRAIEMTPYSRVELEVAKRDVDDDYRFDREIERARRFAVCLYLSFNRSPNRASSFRVSRKTERKYTPDWGWSLAGRLSMVVERLREINVECGDGLDLLAANDCGGNLFYLDPPYLHASRSSNCDYGAHEMSLEEHERLVEVLRSVRRSHVALSSYPNDLYDSLGWRRIDHRTICGVNGEPRVESLYTNYELSLGRLFA